MASLYLARASVEIVSPIRCTSGGIPGGGHADHLRKIRRVAGEATPCSPSFHQSYLGTPSRGIAGAVVAHLLHLLLQGHAPDQVIDPLFQRQHRIHITGLSSLRHLGMNGDSRCEAEQKHRNSAHESDEEISYGGCRLLQ